MNRCTSGRRRALGAVDYRHCRRRLSGATCSAPSAPLPRRTAGQRRSPTWSTRTPTPTTNDQNRPAPAVTFDDHYVLEAGGERLLLDYPGPNHTPGNIFIYAPDHQTLMVVDVIFPGWVPFKNLAVSQDIPDWIHAQDIAMGYQWQTLVGGHLGHCDVLGRHAGSKSRSLA
jgi:glyoxylase-like metal-dependent hydrolase (beta-lactamase superfamily II)